jgi:hypothetical protein
MPQRLTDSVLLANTIRQPPLPSDVARGHVSKPELVVSRLGLPTFKLCGAISMRHRLPFEKRTESPSHSAGSGTGPRGASGAFGRTAAAPV